MSQDVHLTLPLWLVFAGSAFVSILIGACLVHLLFVWLTRKNRCAHLKLCTECRDWKT